MPLIHNAPTSPSVPAPVLPQIESVQTKSNIVDTTNIHVGDIASFVSGYVYVVNYYSQVLGTDQATYGLDANKNGVQQQYRKINRQELRLTSPLTMSQDAKSKMMTVQGEGLVIGRIIANVGDLFVADAGDGREAVFQVNSSEKTSVFKEAVYQIRFAMLFFSYASPERRNDLESKVVDTSHFIRDYARYGRDPIVGDKTYHALARLYLLRGAMIKDYLAWFLSKDRATILVPAQVEKTADPFLTAAMHKIVPVVDFPDFLQARELNLDDENLAAEPTLWEALFERRTSVLKRCRKRSALLRTGVFSQHAMFQSARYSGISRIVYPMPERDPIDKDYNAMDRSPIPERLASKPGINGGYTEMDDSSKPVLTNEAMVGIKPIGGDDFYILSEDFYTRPANPSYSLLEKLVLDYFEGETINAEQLRWLCESYYLWGELERFYYVPILCILTRSLIQEAI